MAHSFRSILKGGSLSAMGTAATALLNIATFKILALTLGPSGTGFYSILKQLVQTCTTVATLNSQSTLVQVVASRDNAEGTLHLYGYLSSAMRLLMIVAAVIVVTLLVAADSISVMLMPADPGQFSLAVQASAPAVLLGAAGAFLGGILIGMRHLFVLVVAQVIGAAIVLACAHAAAQWAASGALVYLVVLLIVGNGVVCSVYAAYLIRIGVLAKLVKAWNCSVDRSALRHFLSISITTFGTGLITALTLLGLRALVARSHGLAGAGLFDAAYTISAGYVGLLLTGFGTYYMPVLAGLHEREERTMYMRRMLLLVMVVMVPMIVALISMRQPLLTLLYSDQFTSAADIMRVMLVADFLKASAWVFSYLTLAFPNMRMLFLADSGCNLVLLLLCLLALEGGMPIAVVGVIYVLVYLFYLALFLLYAYRRHGFSLNRGLAINWMIGCGFVIAAAWWTPAEISSDLMVTLGTCLATLAWALVVLRMRNKLLSDAR